MTKINRGFEPHVAELSAEDRSDIADLFSNDTWFRPYRAVRRGLEPLTGLERVCEVMMEQVRGERARS